MRNHVLFSLKQLKKDLKKEVQFDNMDLYLRVFKNKFYIHFDLKGKKKQGYTIGNIHLILRMLMDKFLTGWTRRLR